MLNIIWIFSKYCGKDTVRNEPNSVGFAHEKARTMSFVERGFERLGLGHQVVGFSWCSYVVKLSSPLESFSWRWAGRLWFLVIFPSLLICAPTFLVYSPSWLILALHLLVRQVLISVSIPSLVPSYFLLVAWIEVYTVQTSFFINQFWVLAGAFTEGGTHFPWSNFTLCFPVGPIPLTSPSGGCLGITFTRTLIFPSKLWSAEDRVASQPFPLALAIDHSSSARDLLGMGHGPR